MTTATHYDALNLIEHLVNNVFQPQAYESACKAPNRTAAKQEQAREETRLVRMDVSETEQEYLLLAEFPGIKKEEIDITIEGKHVLLQAQAKRAAPADENAPRSLLNERFYGKLSRRIQLQQDIDSAAVKATFADGVLQLTLPKKLVAVKKVEIL